PTLVAPRTSPHDCLTAGTRRPCPCRRRGRGRVALPVALALALVVGLAGAILPVVPAPPPETPAAAAPVLPEPGGLSTFFGQLPLSFIANAGQSDPAIAFQARAPGHSLLFGPSRLALVARGAPCAAGAGPASAGDQ